MTETFANTTGIAFLERVDGVLQITYLELDPEAPIVTIGNDYTVVTKTDGTKSGGIHRDAILAWEDTIGTPGGMEAWAKMSARIRGLEISLAGDDERGREIHDLGLDDQPRPW